MKEAQAVLDYFKTKLITFQKNNAKPMRLAVMVCQNRKWEDWKRFEKKLLHFSAVINALQMENMAEFDNLMKNLPATSFNSKENYNKAILEFKKTANKNIADLTFNKLHEVTTAGNSLQPHFILLKAVLLTEPEYHPYLFYIFRSGAHFEADILPDFLQFNDTKPTFANILKALMELGFNNNWLDELGRTVIFRAVLEQQKNAAIALIQNKWFTLDETDPWQYTLLHYAVITNQPEVVQALLDESLEGRRISVDKLTPLRGNSVFNKKRQTAFRIAELNSLTIADNISDYEEKMRQKKWISKSVALVEVSQPEVVIKEVPTNVDISAEQKEIGVQISEIKLELEAMQLRLSQSCQLEAENLARIAELKDNMVELQQLHDKPLQYKRRYEAANLSPIQQQYCDQLGDEFITLFKIIRESGIRKVESDTIVKTMKSKEKSLHRGAVKATLWGAVEDKTRNLSKVMLRGISVSTLMDSSVLEIILRDTARCFFITNMLSGIFASRLKKSKYKKAEDAAFSAKDWFNQIFPRHIKYFAKNLALDVTQKIGHLFDFVNQTDLSMIVKITLTRLAACLYTREFVFEDGLSDMCEKLCTFDSKQAKFLWLFQCSATVPLNPQRVLIAFALTSGNKIQDKLNENDFHKGFDHCISVFEKHGLITKESIRSTPEIDNLPLQTGRVSSYSFWANEVQKRDDKIRALELQLNTQGSQIADLYRKIGAL